MIRHVTQYAYAVLRGAALLLVLWTIVPIHPAGAQPRPASGIAPTHTARDPLTDARSAIDRAQAGVAAVAADVGQTSGPIETGRLISRADDAAVEARQGIATLAAALADSTLTGARRAAVIGQIARGGRVVTAATRLAEEIRASPARRIEQTIAARTTSPLGTRFWEATAAAAPDDMARLARFMAAQAGVTWRGITIGTAWTAMIGLIAAALLLFPIRVWLRQAGRRFMIDRIPQSRLRRSGWALWIAALGGVIPWLAILTLYEGFDASGMVSAPWRPLALGIIRGVAVAAAVWSVAGALLQRNQRSWRLLPVGDATASDIRPWTMLAAIAVFLTIAIDELIAAAALSTPLRDAANLGETLLHTIISVVLLLVIGRARRRAEADTDAAQADAAHAHDGQAGGGTGDGARGRLVAVAVAALVSWLAIGATLVALIMGHVALALLVSRMLVWLPLVGATLYLVWLVADDLATELISGDSALGRLLNRAFGVRASVVDQIGVSLSALFRLLLLLIAAIAAFAPFGSNLSQLAVLAHAIAQGVTIGQITIAPGAILRGLIVLAIGLFVVRVVERWLAESYLPKTELDDGARNSISTVARYAGLLLAASWALAALGIGFERIALILSALSVGIGFGLQAITQNFISGLILLIERPVKIGDLVEVGGQRGDVKRISVRATEIEVADRSTLIVPNSELITKTIRNMTHADPMGVVQLKFTVPLDTDVDAVKQLMLALFAEATAVFDTPDPSVFIDSIDDGAVHFNCTAYCRSPRAAYATRSDVLFRLIMELRARGIAIGSAPAAAAPGPATAAPGSAGVIGGSG